MTQPRPEHPCLGDIHLLQDYGDAVPLNEITDFEVWLGPVPGWVHARDLARQLFTVQDTPP